MDDNPWPSEWMRAVLTLCVLKALKTQPTYGYAIATSLEAAGFGTIKGGTLYPLLTRLENAGWVETDWRAGESGPGRKYFSLTAPGRNELDRQVDQWGRFAEHTRDHLSSSATSKELS